MFRWHYIALLAVAIVWPSVPADAHYIKLEGELVQDGTFTFGVALTGQPFAYKQDGELRGFEIAMARAVAQAHGLALRVVQLARTRLAQALAAGEVDVVNTLALDRDPVAPVMVPYLVVGDHMMVLKGNPFRISTTTDLTGRTVAVTAGTTAERFALTINERLADAGRPPMHIHSFPDQRYTHFPVSMGHAAAYFVQTVSAVAVTQDPQARTRLVEGAFQPRREVGFGVRVDGENIWHAVEHAIAAMVATGKYEQLRKHYGLPIDLSPYH
ncbi:MAG: transporter substrate-binding domain-containing protein [Acidiferrobacterales bacterium]